MPPCDNATWPFAGRINCISGGHGNNSTPMTIWLLFTGLTAAVMALLALPLLRERQAAPARAEFDRAIYRDQLAELERDRERGVLSGPEAEAARNEVARRIIKAEPDHATLTGRRSRMALLGLLLIPAVLPVYVLSGRPQLPGMPLRARLERAVENQDYAALIAKVEAHLADNPGDIAGWKVLAPAYKRLERWSDAAGAYENIVRLSKPHAAVLADYGEMLVFANEGMVTADSRRVFGQALQLDPKHPKARFFNGLALKQEGSSVEARLAFEALLADSPADAPWRLAVQAELAELGSRAPALNDAQMATGAMSGAERQAMILAMVDGLEAKLKANAFDLDGWQRLIRARSVLKEPEKARAALAAAKQQFKEKPDAIASLDGLATELGIE